MFIPNELLFIAHTAISLLPLIFLSRPGYVDLVGGISGLYLFLANLLVMKQTVLFGLHATCVEPLALAIFCAGNFIHARYGKERASLMLVHSLICALIGLITLIFVTAYTPSAYDTTHLLYTTLRTYLNQATFISLAVFIGAYLFERFLYSFFMEKCRLSNKWSGFYALLISQLCDTVLFTLWLFNHRPLSSLIEQISYSYIVKVVAIIILFVTQHIISANDSAQ